MPKFLDILNREVTVGDIVAVAVSPGDHTPPAMPIGRVTKITDKQTTVEIFKFANHHAKTAVLRHIKKRNGKLQAFMYQTPCMIIEGEMLAILEEKVLQETV